MQAKRWLERAGEWGWERDEKKEYAGGGSGRGEGLGHGFSTGQDVETWDSFQYEIRGHAPLGQCCSIEARGSLELSE